MEMPHRIAPLPASTLTTSTADPLMLSQPVCTSSAENNHTNTSPSLEAHPHMDDSEGWATPHETLLNVVMSHRRVNYEGWWETKDCSLNLIRALEGDIDVLKAEIDRVRGERDTAKCKAAAAEKERDIVIEKNSAAMKKEDMATNKKTIAIDKMNIAISKMNIAIDEKKIAIEGKKIATKEKNKTVGKPNTAISSMNKLRDRNNTVHSQMRPAEFQSTWYRAKASTLRKEGNIAIKKINKAINEKIDAAVNERINAAFNDKIDAAINDKIETAINEKIDAAIYESQTATSESDIQSREKDRLENKLAGVKDTLANRDDELKLLEAENARLRERLRSFDDPPKALHRRDTQQSHVPSIFNLSATKKIEMFDKGRSTRGEGLRRRKSRRSFE